MLKYYTNVSQDTWYTMMTCRLPVAACMTGHTIAGGAIIPTVTDYRVCVQLVCLLHQLLV